ncbi:hypothetical protein [Piscirickettsia litoralis]|uniref:Uncharacterized protein n=1 Tax=Piscirickettsia litoralis TaxID=1891921 RepID=A0ABX2ZWM4_9GAMM|nr:hypothetical protein [Piscirickettsia litoralis]ODN41014.1 hypothetical protein BGC07_18455 [Piscirickettsia litoralis]
MPLTNQQIEIKLKNWGDCVQRYADSVGWPQSIFMSICKYGGMRVHGGYIAGMPYLNLEDQEAEQINSNVACLFTSGPEDAQIARVLVLEYCAEGSTERKRQDNNIKKASWFKYKSQGVLYLKGCLSRPINF